MVSHLRSTSLPSMPKSDENKVEEGLQSLNASITSPSAPIETMCDGFRRLVDAYNCIEGIVCSFRNQVGLSQHQQKVLVEEELELSVELLDIYIAMQENFIELKMSIQELQLVLKRGDDATLQAKIHSYVCLVKKARSHFKKTNSMSTSEKQECSLGRLLIEAREMTVSLLESTSHPLSKQISIHKAGKWSLIPKTFKKRKVACEEIQLQALEFNIKDLESGLELLFRRLIQSRVSLLTILSFCIL